MPIITRPDSYDMSDMSPIMYVVMNRQGKFLNTSGSFGSIFDGVKIFDNIEDAQSHIIFGNEYAIHIHITLSTIVGEL